MRKCRKTTAATQHRSEPRSEAQIRRFFGGRHPLCGSGVHSWMLVMIRPLACSVLMDDCLPWPRPLTRSWTYVIPAARFSSHVEVFFGKAHCLSMKVLSLPRQGCPHTHLQHPSCTWPMFSRRASAASFSAAASAA